MSVATAPTSLHSLLAWYRGEFAKETPDRLHGNGVEPASALGTPALNGAFRAYLMGSPYRTDHDDRLDMDRRDEVRLLPIHAALADMERKWPLSARYLFAVGWCGVDWQDVALAWRMLPEVGHRFTMDALRHLYVLWWRHSTRV